MNPRRTIVSLIAAGALSVAIAGPAFAGAPTYSTDLACTINGAGNSLGAVAITTRRELSQLRKSYEGLGCDKGSFEAANLIKNWTEQPARSPVRRHRYSAHPSGWADLMLSMA